MFVKIYCGGLNVAYLIIMRDGILRECRKNRFALLWIQIINSETNWSGVLIICERLEEAYYFTFFYLCYRHALQREIFEWEIEAKSEWDVFRRWEMSLFINVTSLRLINVCRSNMCCFDINAKILLSWMTQIPRRKLESDREREMFSHLLVRISQPPPSANFPNTHQVALLAHTGTHVSHTHNAQLFVYDCPGAIRHSKWLFWKWFREICT